jgi:hypothetical protein
MNERLTTAADIKTFRQEGSVTEIKGERVRRRRNSMDIQLIVAGMGYTFRRVTTLEVYALIMFR